MFTHTMKLSPPYPQGTKTSGFAHFVRDAMPKKSTLQSQTERCIYGWRIQTSFQDRTMKGPCTSSLENSKSRVKSNYQVAITEKLLHNCCHSRYLVRITDGWLAPWTVKRYWLYPNIRGKNCQQSQIWNWIENSQILSKGNYWLNGKIKVCIRQILYSVILQSAAVESSRLEKTFKITESIRII